MFTRWLHRLLTLPIAVLILFEEWGWEPLKRAMGWLMRWAPLASIERRIAALPPYAALAVFFAPSLLLLPVKFGALWLVAHGQALLGLAVIVLAKVAGTALLARLFQLTQPSLMRLPWFARTYTRWVAWKGAVVEQVRVSWVWRSARVIKRRVAQQVRRWRRAT
jgi:hypothetical protein